HPTSPLFPYTTLFRSGVRGRVALQRASGGTQELFLVVGLQRQAAELGEQAERVHGHIPRRIHSVVTPPAPTPPPDARMEFSRRVLFRLTRTWASVPPILFGTRMYLPNDKNAKIWQDRPRRQGEGGPGSFPSPFARPASFPPAPAKGPKKNDENVRN